MLWDVSILPIHSLNALGLGWPSRLEKRVAVLASGSGGFQVDSANISDSPRYTFRGLMIDPARRFLPVVTLQAMMDAMSCERRTSLCFVRNQPCTCLIHTRCWITTRGPHLSCFFAAPTVYPCFVEIRREMLLDHGDACLAPPSPDA